MAEIHVERKKSVWPWIIAALLAALLIWAAVEMLDRDDRVDTAPAATGTAATAPAAATADPAPADGAAAAAPERYAGMFASDSMRLELRADGSYTMQESPAGDAQGRWSHDAASNALRLTPADGSQDRYFRLDGNDALTPLNPDGQPAAQMSQLTRVPS